MFEIFKSTLNKVKNNEEKIEKDEVKALSSIVSLLVEAASIDGQIGDDEKNKILEVVDNSNLNYTPEIESNLKKEIEIAQVAATRPQKQTKTKTEQQQSSLKVFKNISLLTVGKNWWMDVCVLRCFFPMPYQLFCFCYPRVNLVNVHSA